MQLPLICLDAQSGFRFFIRLRVMIYFQRLDYLPIFRQFFKSAYHARVSVGLFLVISISLHQSSYFTKKPRWLRASDFGNFFISMPLLQEFIYIVKWSFPWPPIFRQITSCLHDLSFIYFSVYFCLSRV